MPMEHGQFWAIVDGARLAAADPTDAEAVASQVTDVLADLAVVQAAAADGEDIACDAALIIPRAAYEKATGRELPGGAFTIRYPELEPGWDFDDSAEMRRRLPKLTALCPE